MHEAGATTAEISKYFGISQRMVQHDLKIAPKLLKEAVTTKDGGEILGAEITFWLQVVRQAMRDSQMAESENGKIGFLRVASEARAKLQKLYLDVGLLIAVPTQINVGIENPFTDEEFRGRYTSLLLEARKKGIPIIGL